jgi:hypothetical protein
MAVMRRPPNCHIFILIFPILQGSIWASPWCPNFTQTGIVHYASCTSCTSKVMFYFSTENCDVEKYVFRTTYQKIQCPWTNFNHIWHFVWNLDWILLPSDNQSVCVCNLLLYWQYHLTLVKLLSQLSHPLHQCLDCISHLYSLSRC